MEISIDRSFLNTDVREVASNLRSLDYESDYATNWPQLHDVDDYEF